MCRDNSHGGRRCPHDDATGRRLRDKASKTRATYNNVISAPATPVLLISEDLNIDQVKEKISNLRSEIYNSSDNTIKDDDRFSSEIVQLGTHILKLTEKNLRIDLDAPAEDYKADILAGINPDEALERRKDSERENREILKQSYIRTLSKIRPLGGTVDYEISDSESDIIMSRSVGSHYPSEWIEISNRSSTFTLGTSEDPQYARNVSTEPIEGWEPLNKELTAIYKLATLEAAQTLTSALPSDSQIITVENGDRTTYQVSTTYSPSELYDPKIHKPMMGGRPIGKEWRKEVTPLVLGENILDNKTAEQRKKLILQPRWVRDRPLYIKRTMNILSANDASLDNLEDKASAVDAIAYHEFGHRMEEILPDNILPRMEEAYLRERTNKTEQNFYTNMQTETINNYLYHEGGFVEKYAGREYMQGRYEVFTVGVEAILGKNYGSLSSQNMFYPESDNSHKAFTLGILAVL